MAISVLLNVMYCSNMSVMPGTISGEDAFNRIKLAFSFINSLNPLMYALPYLLTSKTSALANLPDGQTYITTGIAIANYSSENWTKQIVNRKKYYYVKDVDRCVSGIQKIGLLMNLYSYNNSLTSTNAFQAIMPFALTPAVAAGSCNLQPVPDLLILRTGTEGKAEED